MIKAPFTDEQVERLNQYQNCGYVHPFTCGNDECRAILKATKKGWVCEHCGYTQDWAHDLMIKHDWESPSTEDVKQVRLANIFRRVCDHFYCWNCPWTDEEIIKFINEAINEKIERDCFRCGNPKDECTCGD